MVGDYLRTLQRYWRNFAAERVKATLFEDLKSSHKVFWEEPSEFLGTEINLSALQARGKNTGVLADFARVLWRAKRLAQSNPRRKEHWYLRSFAAKYLNAGPR